MTFIALRVAFAAIALAMGVAHAAEVKVLASAALKSAYLELQPEFEKVTGYRLVTEWAPTGEIAKRVAGGEAVDVVIMAADRIDELMKTGRIVPGSRVDLARSGIGIATRAAAPAPDLSSVEAFKRALSSSKSIVYSTGLSGVYVADLLKRLGLAEELKPRIRQVAGVPIGEIVARGEADIGFQQMSELFPVAGIRSTPLPAEIQHVFHFAAGIPAAARYSEAARALSLYLTTPAAAEAIRKTGLEPG